MTPESRIQSTERAVHGVIAMNRMLKDRVKELERRLDAAEQAILETARELNPQPGTGELVSPFAPVPDSSEAASTIPA